jgi:hypothetical protein
VEPAAPLPGLDDAPLEADPLPGCWRCMEPLEPLALPEPLIPLLLLPDRAPLSLLPPLAFRPWLSPQAERAKAIAATITPIESFFMIAPSTFEVGRRRSPDGCPPGHSPAR